MDWFGSEEEEQRGYKMGDVPKLRLQVGQLRINNLDELTDEQVSEIAEREDIRKYDLNTRLKIAKRLQAPQFVAKTPGESMADAVDTSNVEEVLFGGEDEIEEALF